MAVGFLSHRSRFDSSRPCRLSPAHHGMKLGTLVGGRVRVSLAPAAPPLDSRFCGNDEVGGRNDETGRFNALVGGGVCGSFSPRIPLPWIPAFAGMTNWAAGMTHWGSGMTHWGSGMRMVGRRTVTTRAGYPPRPGVGTSPSATLSPSTAGCKFTARQV